MTAGIFEDKPASSKFLIVVGVVLFSTGVFTLLGGFLSNMFYGVDMVTDPDVLSHLDDPAVLSALKLVQIMSTGIGMFLVPSFVIAFLFSRDPAGFLFLTRELSAGTVLNIIVLMMAAVPLINFMLSLNQGLSLPAFLEGIEEWMIANEQAAEKLTQAFLTMTGPGDLALNLFMMALLPALGEELMFRGIIQGLIKQLTGNIHAAVIIAAVVFSAFHMQFFGFLPRMILGMIFGYLLVWSGNIWLPVIAHFVNNAAAVIFAWYAGNQVLPFDQDTIGTGEGEWKLTVVSVILVALTALVIRRTYSRKQRTV